LPLMHFKKTAKPQKLPFTDEQIRDKAYQIWQQDKERSPEENWNTAIKLLKTERRFQVLKQPLICVWRWTGIPEKKGWDLMTGLLIPALIFGGGISFTYLNNQQQQEIADDKQKDEVLKNYFDNMKSLLLDKDHPLRKSKVGDESRSIARTLTLTALSQLTNKQDKQKNKQDKQEGEHGNDQRKGLVIHFLFESGLIQTAPPLIRLSGANLREAELTFADLSGVNLREANLSGADLRMADLSGANLNIAYISVADLRGADLRGANLRFASLGLADLRDANLSGADLRDVNLSGANIEGADFRGADLRGAYHRSTNLRGAYHRNADLRGATLCNTTLPNGEVGNNDCSK
jgi:uncharacterized protein YjbI with pentapeptide repeats